MRTIVSSTSDLPHFFLSFFLSFSGNPEDVQVRALWAVRALIQGNRSGQTRFGEVGGVETLIARIQGQDCADISRLADVQEAAMAVLVPAVVDHEVSWATEEGYNKRSEGCDAQLVLLVSLCMPVA